MLSPNRARHIWSNSAMQRIPLYYNYYPPCPAPEGFYHRKTQKWQTNAIGVMFPKLKFISGNLTTIYSPQQKIAPQAANVPGYFGIDSLLLAETVR